MTDNAATQISVAIQAEDRGTQHGSDALPGRIWSSVCLQRGETSRVRALLLLHADLIGVQLGLGEINNLVNLSYQHQPQTATNYSLFDPPPCTAGLGPEGHRRQWPWPPGCTLGMEVLDPRLALPLRVGGMCFPLPGLQPTAAPLTAGQLARQMKAWPTGGWTRVPPAVEWTGHRCLSCVRVSYWMVGLRLPWPPRPHLSGHQLVSPYGPCGCPVVVQVGISLSPISL